MSTLIWLKVLKIAAIVLLAYLFTEQVVHLSKLYGRLATVPGYDDIAYFYSGLDLATAWHDKGSAGWWDHFRRLSSHAPYSEFLAGFTFYFHGYSARKAYEANVYLVITFLFLLLYFFRQLKTYVQFVLLACFLTLPYASMMVAEFRPDLAWATLLGFGAVYVVTRRDFYEKLSPTVVYGIVTGLALLAKPSTFVMTLFITGLAFGSRFVLEFYRQQSPPLGKLFGKGALRAVIIAVIATVLVFPFAYYFGRGIWDYFIFGVFGVGRKVFDAYAHHPWNYYIWGPAYDSNLNHNGDILMIAALLVLYAFRKSISRYDKTELELLLILMLVPYVISIKAPIVSPFLGPFYGTMIFTIAYIFGSYGPRYFTNTLELHRVEPEAAGRPKTVRIATLTPARQNVYSLGFLFLLCFLTYEWPPYSDSGHTGLYMRDVTRKLYDYFHASPFPARICLTQASPITPEDLLIWYMVHGQKRPFIESAGLAMSVDQAFETIQKDDVIITQDTGLRGTTPWLPCEKLQDAIVARLMSSPVYHLVYRFNDGSGRYLYIFRRDVPAPAHPDEETTHASYG